MFNPRVSYIKKILVIIALNDGLFYSIVHKVKELLHVSFKYVLILSFVKEIKTTWANLIFYCNFSLLSSNLLLYSNLHETVHFEANHKHDTFQRRGI